jgi:hypothetical protein
LLVLERAVLVGVLRVEQGAGVAAGLILEAVRLVGEGVPQGHGEAGLTERCAVFVETQAMAAALGEGDGGEAFGGLG